MQKTIGIAAFCVCSLLMFGCSNYDEINGTSILHPIKYRIDNVSETRATLVTNDNVEMEHPEMAVEAVMDDTRQFIDYFETSTTEATSIKQSWNADSYVFYSYPSDLGLSTRFKDNAMLFDYTVATNSTDTPDIIVARTVQQRGNTVSFKYNHVFTAVNVIYKTAKIGHKITKIAIKDSFTTGKCKITEVSGDVKIYWDNKSNVQDIVDKTTRYATQNNQELTEDGCKFMVIPYQKITLEVVIDGQVLYATCESKNPGDIVNFYIEDDFTIKKEDGSAAEGTIEQNPNGTYKMTLETYVTGEYKTTIVAKPMDFILVLDFSSSMKDSYTDKKKSSYTKTVATAYSFNDWKKNKTGFKATLNGTQYTITCTDQTNSGTDNIHWAYITVGSTRYYVGPDGGLYQSTNTSPSMSNIPVSTDGIKIFPTVGGNPKLFSTISTVSSTSISNRINGLLSGVSDFVDLVAKNAKDNNVAHRVAIVAFQNARLPRFTSANSDRKKYVVESYEYYLRQCFAKSGDDPTSTTTDVIHPFRSITDLNVQSSLKSCMTLSDYTGATAIDYGMYEASMLMKQTRSDAGKTIIVFTDGKPTGGTVSADNVIAGYNNSSTNYTEKQVSDGAVSLAKTCKDKGATIYTIGVFNSSDKPSSTMMDAISSNYPNATSTTSMGEGSHDKGYYMDASNGDLTTVFETIAKKTGEASIDIHQDAYVTAIISDAFVLPDDYIEGSGNMTFYECAQIGYDTATKKIVWSTIKTDVTSQIDCIMDPTTQTIKIKGFDYGKNYCLCEVADTYTGKKLVMVFDALVSNPDKEGSGSNQAIEYTTGLYDKDGNPVSMFDPIYVNL